MRFIDRNFAELLLFCLSIVIFIYFFVLEYLILSVSSYGLEIVVHLFYQARLLYLTASMILLLALIIFVTMLYFILYLLAYF
jgi:hypothetical protein